MPDCGGLRLNKKWGVSGLKLDNDELKDYDLWCVRTSPDSGQRGRRTVMKLLFLFGLVWFWVCV